MTKAVPRFFEIHLGNHQWSRVVVHLDLLDGSINCPTSSSMAELSSDSREGWYIYPPICASDQRQRGQQSRCCRTFRNWPAALDPLESDNPAATFHSKSWVHSIWAIAPIGRSLPRTTSTSSRCVDLQRTPRMRKGTGFWCYYLHVRQFCWLRGHNNICST